MTHRKQLDRELDQWRQRLGEGGRRCWQSLEELAESDAFQALVKQEFPDQADQWPDALSRRSFLAMMAASLALGGVGCSIRPAPAEKIVPYVRPQSEMTPGRPLFFATTMTQNGDAVGLLVESHLGRPIKIEGNPDHPASRGATSALHQASVLTLYDPDRSQTVTYQGQIRTWNDAQTALRQAIVRKRDAAGAGLHILTETIVSPTLADQLQRLLGDYSAAKWRQYDPVNDDHALAGAELAFGEKTLPVFDFAKADVVLALDADFLATGPGSLRYARDFMERRRLPTRETQSPGARMNRLYVAEPMVTCTGAKADQRLAIRGSRIEVLARSVAAELGIAGKSDAADLQKWAHTVARDLQAHRGRSLVLAGYRQPPIVHLLAHALNDHLENVGQTVRYIAPVMANPVQRTESLRQLVNDLRDDKVETLLILGGNPVYTAPADFQFADALRRAKATFHLSLYADETSALCDWRLPQAHYLESWSDARAFDGAASLVQPLIEPLYGGRTAHEVIATLTNSTNPNSYEMVRSYWRGQANIASANADFEDWWETALHDGVIADSAFAAKSLTLEDQWKDRLEPAPLSKPLGTSTAFELAFDADPAIHDGSLANNGWLQELPKPITKITWDNAALLSPRAAERLGLQLGASAHGGEHGGHYAPVVELQAGGRKVLAPIWIVPGHADDAVTIHLGYGRRAAGRVGGNRDRSLGFDAFALRTSAQPWFASEIQLTPTGQTYPLACTQSHHALNGRDMIRGGTLAEFQQDPRRWKEPPPEHQLAPPRPPLPLTIYASETKQVGESTHRWGMSINLTACTGCSACVVACQAENNIPVVGKEQVLFGREMHWLRIDRYIEGTPAEPEAFHFQPLPCMHCEHAPCEYVCPVGATVHSSDGLNDMVYNRCVGTRFCSNNCPYKVRRFNFLAYSDFDTPSRRLQYNPDVTVRSRGVMEKCTYCVQRIRSAEIDAEAGLRPLRDGDVLTACQAACPTQAIVFGDLNDAASRVRQAKDSPLEYALLAELNTFPRTSYLAEVRNPNPELETSAP